MNIYGLSRVSTIGQSENTSLSFQSKRINDYCNLHNLSLKEIIVETESGAKSVEDRSGLSKLKVFSEGKKPYGSIPYGYRKNRKGELVLDIQESLIVQYIYKRYLTLSKMKHLTKTKRTQKLLHSLHIKGYEFRGKKFEWWNVKQILSNPFYTGIMRWSGKVSKHNYDTIISKRMYNKVSVV